VSLGAGDGRAIAVTLGGRDLPLQLHRKSRHAHQDIAEWYVLFAHSLGAERVWLDDACERVTASSRARRSSPGRRASILHHRFARAHPRQRQDRRVHGSIAPRDPEAAGFSMRRAYFSRRINRGRNGRLLGERVKIADCRGSAYPRHAITIRDTIRD